MAKKTATPKTKIAALVAPGSPHSYRVRVRMYRQGLGDCFLITFPRKNQLPFQMLIDCGALARDAAFMTTIVEHIRDTILDGKHNGKARLDVVVATHEHKDHLSGFNQARRVFNDDFDFGSVWLGWTENLTKPQIQKIKEAKKKAAKTLKNALAIPAFAGPTLAGVTALFNFSSDDDTTGSGRIAEALEYLKLRGKEAGDLRYLNPGADPIELDGVEGVRVYVLGPPHDPILLKGSEVTQQMKQDDVVYHLSSTENAGIEALNAALSTADSTTSNDDDRYYPFSAEHRIAQMIPDPQHQNVQRPNPYYEDVRAFVDDMYNGPTQEWRRIDQDWLSAFGQLALNLDSDTNNTSLVLAFEFVETQEVLLFVGDAQVGNWQSWANVSFKVPGRDKPLPAHDLLSRTVFYKVGHHCSHNATLKKGGLEMMTRDDLVAFIPLDKDTASKQGPKGWEMPAPPLFKALKKRSAERVVISDVAEALTPEATQAGVVATGTYIDYFLT